MTTLNYDIFLQFLTLTNFATFEKETIEFVPGLNSITGETGSGKSLILDALQFIFGQRADKSFIRKNAEFSIIEAQFKSKNNNIKKYFDHLGHPYDNGTIQIKRILYRNGSSKAYLNFHLTSLQTIQQFAKSFIDLVGQFENQKLLSPEYQIKILDKYASCEDLQKKYQAAYNGIQDYQKSLEQFNELNKNREQRVDYIKFQLEAISNLAPSPEREKELLRKKKLLQEARESQSVISHIDEILSNNEHSVLNTLSTTQRLILENQQYFSKDFITKLESLMSTAEEISYEISRKTGIENEDNDFESILDELDLYQKLKRKFGGSTEFLVESWKNFELELKELDNISIKIEEIERNLSEATERATTLAQELHEKRKKSAAMLSEDLSLKIRKLKMENAVLDIQCTPSKELLPNGMTHIKFVAQTNLGEHIAEVKKIASGGELSRILLALRQVLSSKDSISIFLFDEIDAGIGGQTALAIGNALKEVASHSQVITITHLPQIAHFSDKVISVNKRVTTNRTHSLVHEYTGNDIEKSISQMTPLPFQKAIVSKQAKKAGGDDSPRFS